MLVATREPLTPQDHKPEPPRGTGHARVMGALQLTGAVLGIPVALGSAYTVYQANFSPDIACQALRSSIISMIDRQLDAATRRMLVRRDVETFERTCGAFDPDAKAAFVSLLAGEPKTASGKVDVKADGKTAAAKPEPRQIDIKKVEAAKAEAIKPAAKPELKPMLAVDAPRRPDVKPEPKVDAKAEVKAEPKIEPKLEPRIETKVETKAEPRIEAKIEPKADTKAEAKPAALAAPPAAAAETAQENDARWLDAVRGALVTQDAPARVVETPAVAAPAPQKSARAAMPLPSWVAEEPAPRPAPVAAPAVQTVPALPPPTAIASPVSPPADDPDRPVPPGAIPNAQPTMAQEPASHQPAREGWLSKIPLVGSAIAERF